MTQPYPAEAVERLRHYLKYGTGDGNFTADLAALLSYVELMKWRPIESAPSKGQRVLICRYSHYNGKPIREIAWHVPQFFQEDSSDDQIYAEENESGYSYIKAGWYHDFDAEHFSALETAPYYWLPLPPPPDSEPKPKLGGVVLLDQPIATHPSDRLTGEPADWPIGAPDSEG